MRSADSATSRATGIWLVLLAATLAAWWIADRQAVSAPLATTAALLAAAFKVRLVLMHFMELRHAPLRWRALFEAWLLLSFSLILAGYWLVPA